MTARKPRKDAMERLLDGERVLCAYAQSANGPGWANSPVWVVIGHRGGSFREVCIQPAHQTRDMLTMYRVSEEVNAVMVSEAVNVLSRRTRRGER